jgi:hypothetical protein
MLARPPRSCAEAKRRKLSTSFTGEPCRHGHIAERVTASGSRFRFMLPKEFGLEVRE